MNEPEIIQDIFENAKTIAIVGISNKPDRPSYHIAAEMQKHGYKIVPVNPVLKEVLGEPAYPSLKEIPFPVDVVDVFRAPEFVPQIVEDTIAIGAKYLWLQQDIVHPEAIAHAEANGIHVVADRCIYQEYARWRTARASK